MGHGQIFGGAAGVGVMTLLLNYTSVTNAMWYMSIFMFISIFMLPLLHKKGKQKQELKLKNDPLCDLKVAVSSGLNS